MQTLTLVIRYISVKLDFLVILNKSLCVFRTFKVTTSKSPHLHVGIGHLGYLLLTGSENFLVLLFLLVD